MYKGKIDMALGIASLKEVLIYCVSKDLATIQKALVFWVFFYCVSLLANDDCKDTQWKHADFEFVS